MSNTDLMKTLLALVLAATTLCSTAQKTLVDERDGESYKTLRINNLLWTKEHLRYRTPESWCQKFPESGACEFGNFFFPSELELVCPKGWRIPTWNDYDSSVRYLIDSLKIDSATFQNNVVQNKRKGVYADIIRGISIIQDTLFFDMEFTGWIQGMKWEKQDQTTIWVNDTSEMYQPHVHIREEGFLKHAHKHSVIDKPKKLRRFNVRCVCEVIEE